MPFQSYFSPVPVNGLRRLPTLLFAFRRHPIANVFLLSNQYSSHQLLLCIYSSDILSNSVYIYVASYRGVGHYSTVPSTLSSANNRDRNCRRPCFSSGATCTPRPPRLAMTGRSPIIPTHTKSRQKSAMAIFVVGPIVPT